MAMYHKRQYGLLCGQPAINNLLQGQFYSAMDLADLANELDTMERLFIQMVMTLLEVNARGARRILAVENDGMMNLIIGDGLNLRETILVEGAGMMDRSAREVFHLIFLCK